MERLLFNNEQLYLHWRIGTKQKSYEFGGKTESGWFHGRSGYLILNCFGDSVLDCPAFDPDHPRRPQSIDDRGETEQQELFFIWTTRQRELFFIWTEFSKKSLKNTTRWSNSSNVIDAVLAMLIVSIYSKCFQLWQATQEATMSFHLHAYPIALNCTFP